MNALQIDLDRIVDIVVSSCITAMTLQGEQLVTKDEILSPSKKQNIVKARHILAFALHKYGYTYSTICCKLGCTKSAVSKMIGQHEQYKKINRAYYLACRSIKMTLEGNADL